MTRDYMHFILGLRLQKRTPANVRNLLRWLIRDPNLPEQPDLPSHGFFRTAHWTNVLSGSSYYFPGQSSARLEYDKTAEEWFLTVNANCRNYENEIVLFLQWIRPHVAETEHAKHQPVAALMGYACAQDAAPTLIYFHRREFLLQDVEFPTGTRPAKPILRSPP